MNPNIHLYIVVCSLCSSLSFAQSGRATRVEYIEKHKLTAVSEMENSGVSASILLAQAMLQSTSGSDELATSANNHFHMLCTNNWYGETHYTKDSTRQFIQIKCYKKYRDVEAAYTDYARALTANEKKIRLFDNNRSDYNYWARIIQEKEAPDNLEYSKRLIQVIKKYKLHRYDNMTSDDLMSNSFLTEDEAFIDLPPTRSQREIIIINRLPAIQTQVDDTPLAIARYYNIPLKKLLQYNDLQTDKFRSLEQNIFLRPKRRKRCDVETHTVKRGETMYSIAQTHGIRLNTLYKLNRIAPDKEPIAEQAIYLCKQRKTVPKQIEMKPTLPAPRKWQLIPPKVREKTLRRPKVPRVNDGTEIIDPQFIRFNIYSESSLY